jgi:hypothetical protein
MTTTNITITDPDQARDYRLTVVYDYLPGQGARMGWGGAGDPGEAPAVEITSARCTEIVSWCGKVGVSAFPALDPRQSLESPIGAWCMEKYRTEIEAAVLEHHQAASDAA